MSDQQDPLEIVREVLRIFAADQQPGARLNDLAVPITFGTLIRLVEEVDERRNPPLPVTIQSFRDIKDEINAPV